MPDYQGKFRCYLLFGAPGSGKGTQGKILGSIPRFFHFACGEVFRALDTRTPIGRKFLEYSSRGELVPDEVTIELWIARIRDNVESHLYKPDIDYLILDGIPRNVRQAELMERFIEVQRVFHLVCPDRERLIQRMRKRALKENRLDDASEAVIRRRLETYDKETAPLLEYYRGKVIDVDAMQPPVCVVRDLLQHIIADGAGKMPEQIQPAVIG